MPSAAFPELQNFVRDEYRRIEQDHVIPWNFFNAGPPMHVVDFYGKQISYAGLEFSGSPRDIFWGNFIEPFLQDLVVRTAAQAVKFGDEREIDREDVLEDTKILMDGIIHAAYNRMQDIDRRLRGGGYPLSVDPVDISEKRAHMERFVVEILNGWRAKPSWLVRASKSFERHQIIYWMIGLVVTVVLALLAL